MSSLSKYNSENENFILKKNNKNDYIENDNFNDISLSKNLTPISRNEINNEYNYENSNFMTHNNISPINKDITHIINFFIFKISNISKKIIKFKFFVIFVTYYP